MMNNDNTPVWSSTDSEYDYAIQESIRLYYNSMASNKALPINDLYIAQEKDDDAISEYDTRNGSYSQNNRMQRSSSVDKPVACSHVDSDYYNLQYESRNNGGNDKFLYSGFNNSHHTSPKITNMQNENNSLNNVNDKTDKLHFQVRNKFSPSIELKQYSENKKSALIKYAKDIANLIIECERAQSDFKSSYDEWSIKRSQSIDVLSQIVLAIESSSWNGKTIKNLISVINLAGKVASPNVFVSAVLHITGAVVGVLAKLVGDGMNKKDLETKEFKIKEIFQQDMILSSSVYNNGVICSTKFVKTCSLIEEFHQLIQSENFPSITDDEDVTEFLNEISEYNPSNFVFYKRLKFAYEKLMLTSKSKEGKAFCRVFEDVPESLNTINLLLWWFDTDGFDHSIVQPYWQQLFDFLHDSESKNIDDFLKKVKECILLLKKERFLLDKSVRHLFKEENIEKEKLEL